MRVDVAVVGGGASGLMAALCAARAGAGRVIVLERLNRVGKKLMATGNGRCNLTNVNLRDADYHGGAYQAQNVLAAYPPERVMRFFELIGVQPHVEETGRVYPLSDQASSVLDALRLALQEAGGEEIVDFELRKIVPDGRDFLLCAADRREVRASRVIMATGGVTAPNLGGSESGLNVLRDLGHAVERPFPALVQIKTETESIRALKGIRFTGRATIEVDQVNLRSEEGEILFTEYGLSGIPILQLSRIAYEAMMNSQAAYIGLSVLTCSVYEAERLLLERRENLQARTLENFLTGLVNKRLGQTLIKEALKLNGGNTAPGFFDRPVRTLTEREISLFASFLTGWWLQITGAMGFDQAQVTMGGVRGGEFHPDTLESARVPGLYLTGELIDIDGDSGGFNLQWAWASGMAAGAACAESLRG